mmetsp:Transcript_3241/g.11266  ORF Transcript_3241/g.11266 Transcript_3241/m.11266 type:complete len:277 (-) Transcript_3241:517-1347(-)
MQSHPASPVAALAARNKCELSFAAWKTTLARICPSVKTSTTCLSMPSALPSALALPSKRSASMAQWSSEARRARSATARDRNAPFSPPGGMPLSATASSVASNATLANSSPPPPPAESATASAACPRNSRALFCSCALISVRGGSVSAPSALIPRDSNTKAYSSRPISARRHCWRMSGDALCRPPLVSSQSKTLRAFESAPSACSTACNSSDPVPVVMPSQICFAAENASAASRTDGGASPFSRKSLSIRSVTVLALKKSFSSLWKIRNSSTNAAG